MSEKYFLLIAGASYYPQAGSDDWVGTYSSKEEAESEIEYIQHTRTITKGKRKGEVEVTHTTYKVKGEERDWFEIIDLREWISNR